MGFGVFFVQQKMVETTLPEGLETSGQRHFANFVIFLHVSEFLRFWWFFSVFQKIRFLGILGPPSYGIGATISIRWEMLCLPYAGFYYINMTNQDLDFGFTAGKKNHGRQICLSSIVEAGRFAWFSWAWSIRLGWFAWFAWAGFIKLGRSAQFAWAGYIIWRLPDQNQAAAWSIRTPVLKKSTL